MCKPGPSAIRRKQGAPVFYLATQPAESRANEVDTTNGELEFNSFLTQSDDMLFFETSQFFIASWPD